jgi:hypothetical protein
MFCVLPRGLPGGAHAPGGDRILQMRDRRQRFAEEPHIQRGLGGFNEAVKRGVQRGVVVIERATAIRSCARDLTGADNRFRQVVIDMGVYAHQRELDARDCASVAAVEQNLPARGSCRAGERGFKGGEVETCELHVEFGKPGGIAESAPRDPRFHRLRHLQIQPVELHLI